MNLLRICPLLVFVLTRVYSISYHEKDQLKLGIAIRNVGRMRFGGEGLSKELDNPNSGTISYLLTYDQQSASFELPSLLNMGLSYDFLIGTK